MTVVSIDKDSNFACVAPLSIVFLRLALDNLVNLAVFETFSAEFFNPFWQLVRIPKKKLSNDWSVILAMVFVL